MYNCSKYRAYLTPIPYSFHMIKVKKINSPAFRTDGGEMGGRIRNFVNHAPVAICVLRGPHYIVEVANEKMLEIWGKTAEQMMDNPVFQAMPDAADQGLEELLNEVYKTGKPFIANELSVNLIRNGVPELVFLNFVYEPLYGFDKTVTSIVAVATEVTEQINARKEIEASEKRFSNILSQSLMAIAIFKGPDLVIEFANEPMINVFGKGNAVLNKPLLEVLPEIKDQGFPKMLLDVYNTGVAVEGFETKAVIVRNGLPGDAYFNFVYQPFRDIDNTIIGVTALATEVTEQVLAKNQNEESKNRFRHVLEQAPDPILVLKGENMVLDLANDPLFKVWGVDCKYQTN